MNGNTLIIKKIAKLFGVSLRVEDVSFDDQTTRLLIQDVVDVSRPTNENPALKLFKEQAVTICRCGPEVYITCDNNEEADSIFLLLESLGG
jgi:hypothetical protein